MGAGGAYSRDACRVSIREALNTFKFAAIVVRVEHNFSLPQITHMTNGRQFLVLSASICCGPCSWVWIMTQRHHMYVVSHKGQRGDHRMDEIRKNPLPTDVKTFSPLYAFGFLALPFYQVPPLLRRKPYRNLPEDLGG